MVSRVISIPHIQIHITSFLTKRELVQCTLVCKQWYHWFNSILWHEPTSNLLMDPIGPLTLFRYQHHVRTINDPRITRAIIDSMDQKWTFSGLHSFQFQQSEVIPPIEIVFEWIQGISTLQDLEIEITRYSHRTHEALISTLNILPNLSSFRLIQKTSIPFLSKQDIIVACSRLFKLCLNDFSYEPRSEPSKMEYESNLSIFTSNLERIQDMKVRHLDIRLGSPFEECCILIPLLKICHSLECLVLNSTFQFSITDELVNVFQSGCCPNLQDLSLMVIESQDYRNVGLASVMKSIGDGSSPYCQPRRLSSISLGNHIRVMQQHVSALTDYHFSTLTKLHLLDTTHLDINLFFEMMHKFPNLRCAEAKIWVRYMEYGSLFAEELLDMEWSCLGLSKLSLNIERGYSFRTIESAPEAPIDYLTKQIGNLYQLTELNLHTKDYACFSIRGPQYLLPLSGLKQLQRFTYCSQRPSLTIAEAQWMIENWTKLKSIRAYSGIGTISYGFLEYMKKAGLDFEF